jgi:hypothetical protein
VNVKHFPFALWLLTPFMHDAPLGIPPMSWPWVA